MGLQSRILALADRPKQVKRFNPGIALLRKYAS
jgi:hypothetical protein